jgi:hypothetical protein
MWSEQARTVPYGSPGSRSAPVRTLRRYFYIESKSSMVTNQIGIQKEKKVVSYNLNSSKLLPKSITSSYLNTKMPRHEIKVAPTP